MKITKIIIASCPFDLVNETQEKCDWSALSNKLTRTSGCVIDYFVSKDPLVLASAVGFIYPEQRNTLSSVDFVPRLC